MATRRMTVSQAIVEFLAHQYTVDGDVRVRTIQGVYGIFGHGNVAGIGQALLQTRRPCLTTRPATSKPWFTSRLLTRV